MLLQLHIQRPDRQVQAFDLLTAHQRHRADRVIQDPGVDDGRRLFAVLLGDLPDHLHRLFTVLIAAPKEPAARQRGPDHRVDLMRGQIVHVAVVEMLVADRVPLDLVRDELPVHRGLQRVELEGIEVGHAGLADQALRLQLFQGLGGIPRVKERILPVDQVQIDVIGAQSLQCFFAGPDHAVVRGIVVTEIAVHINATLRDQLDAAADGRVKGKRIAHQRLADRAPVDFCRVEGGDAALDAGIHERRQFLRAHVPAVQPPEALDNAGK